MNDALGVRRIQTVGDLNAKIEQGFDVQRFAADRSFESLALEQLHGDEMLDRQLRQFRRWCRCSGGSGRTPPWLHGWKRSSACGIIGEFLRKELQRDEAAKPGVFGLINHAHAAAA